MSAPSSAHRELDLSVGPHGEASKEHTATCHLMPCSIEHDQLDVKAREYFWPTVRELKAGGDDQQGRDLKHDKSLVDQADPDNPVLLASFRGRPLQGRRVRLPDGYAGHVLNKEPPAKLAEQERKIKKHFDSFTYWNWDELPNKNDAVVKALSWVHVAKTIHDPIE